MGRLATHPAERRRGPSLRALAVLGITALALLATSPLPPTLEGRVIGQVVLSGGESLERELHVRVDPAGGGATTGDIGLRFQAASGLQSGYTRDATLTLVGASDAAGSFAPDLSFPVKRCVDGCDLVYRIRIAAAPNVAPASVVRYEVNVRLQYQSGFGPRDPGLMRLDLADQATGPVAPVWSILDGMLALIGGIAVGPTVHRLSGTRRRWPAYALVALAIGQIAWMIADGAINLARFAGRGEIDSSPLLLLAFADPWSVVLIGTLAWGVWLGLRRWPADGGQVLGLAAVAMVGLGGLWLAWSSTLEAVIQPVVLAIPFVMLGGLGGIVIGQAWRADERAKNDRWWLALAVLSHGILIAGFGFVAVQPLFDPFSSGPISLLTLIPAALVALAFRHWLRGRQPWLIVFDLLIAAVGVLGFWFWFSSFGLSANPRHPSTEDVGVLIAVAAALVALVTSLHDVRARPRDKHAGTSGTDGVDPIVALSPPAPVADPPTR